MACRVQGQPRRSHVKVFVDTNVLISYLLGWGRHSAVSSALRAGIQGEFDLVISREILDELTRNISDKPYLRSRIPDSALATFLRLMANTSQILDAIDATGVNLSRDKADNFVLLQAIAADADVILTGDRDLLVLNAIGHIRIVNPNDFLDMLSEMASPES